MFETVRDSFVFLLSPGRVPGVDDPFVSVTIL